MNCHSFSVLTVSVELSSFITVSAALFWHSLIQNLFAFDLFAAEISSGSSNDILCSCFGSFQSEAPQHHRALKNAKIRSELSALVISLLRFYSSRFGEREKRERLFPASPQLHLSWRVDYWWILAVFHRTSARQCRCWNLTKLVQFPFALRTLKTLGRGSRSFRWLSHLRTSQKNKWKIKRIMSINLAKRCSRLNHLVKISSIKLSGIRWRTENRALRFIPIRLDLQGKQWLEARIDSVSPPDLSFYSLCRSVFLLLIVRSGANRREWLLFRVSALADRSDNRVWGAVSDSAESSIASCSRETTVLDTSLAEVYLFI